MKTLILGFILLVSSIPSYSNDWAKALNDPELKKELDKMSPEEREKAAMVFLSLMMFDQQMNKVLVHKTFSPIKLNTGKEGFIFSAKVPFITTKRIESHTETYKDIKEERIYWKVDNLTRHCGGCFKARKYPENKLQMKFYPTGSQIKFEYLLYVPDGIITVFKDSKGNQFTANEYDAQDIIDGGPGGMQNEEMLYIDNLKADVREVTMPVKIEKYELEKFQKVNIPNNPYWDFPPLRSSIDKNLKSDDHLAWLNAALKAYSNKSKLQVTLKNFRKTEYDLVYDMTASPISFALLSHIGLINPYKESKERINFYKIYTDRRDSQTTFVLGEKAEKLFKDLKAKQQPHKPDPEELKKLQEQANKIIKEEIEKKKAEKKSP